jgi:hypothetical protein
VPQGWRDAIAAADQAEREEGAVALALQVGCGPAFGLRVGLGDGPIATAPARE